MTVCCSVELPWSSDKITLKRLRLFQFVCHFRALLVARPDTISCTASGKSDQMRTSYSKLQECEALRMRLQGALSTAANNGQLQSCLKVVVGDEAGAEAQECRMLAKKSILQAIENASAYLCETFQVDIKNVVKEPPIRMQVADIQTSFELSKGEFGSTRIAVSTRDIEEQVDKLYAWKCTSKREVLVSQRLNSMYVEKHVLARMSHPFVVRCFGYAQDSVNLYLCLEPWEAGNLKQHLQIVHRFDDDRARFYTASVILALRYIHSMGIICRSVVPESVVMCFNGYVKLVDFSLAKLTKPDRVELEVSDTMPEVVLRGRSGFANTPADLLPKYTHVDWWMLAILIYEMIVGRPPVIDASAEDQRDYLNTWNGQSAIHIPRYFRAQARSLMKKLLHLELDDVDVIMQQSWFADFDFEALEKQNMSAPWRPQKEVELFSARLRMEPFKRRDPDAETVEQQFGGQKLAWFKDW